MKLKVVGTLAYDSVKSDFGSKINQLGGSAVYFAISSSYWCDEVKVTGSIGTDFKSKDLDLISSMGIDLSGVVNSDLKTFRWEGEYKPDSPNEAITLGNSIIRGDANVLDTYKPDLFTDNENIKEKYSLFLANTSPENQMSLLNQIDQKPNLIALDTMDFWINNYLSSVKELFPLIDVLVINENEARLITGNNSLKTCIDALFELNIKRMVIKLGNYGLIYASHNERYFLPAILVDHVKDPTGAGDSFAGGFMGYLSTVENFAEKDFKEACLIGSVMASFCVEEFGVKGLMELTKEKILNRKKYLINQITL
jgi:sugar/nucleoside kinase (ribokinase family)